MAQKKKIKLKKKFRRLLLLLIIVLLCTYFGVNFYKDYKYKQTTEYKLLEKGYESETVELIQNKLDDDSLTLLLSEDKIDYVKEILSEKYFIEKNFEEYLSFYQENSKKSFNDVVTLVNVGATDDWYSDVKITDTSDKYTVLVNKFYALPEDYDVGTIKTFSSTYAYGTVSAEETCYDAFIEMAKSAKEDGITLILTSGYRTYEYQEKLYDDMKASKGEAYADEYAARPGHSEHETGLALDIFTYGGLMETFKTTETYAWLKENASKFGFIERYQEGKEYITGYEAESWHFRYIGVELAQAVEESGLTYDEYYAYYLDK